MERENTKVRSKVRLAPEVYFLPRRSLPVTLGVYGTIVLAGFGAGMLAERWIIARVFEDGGFVTLGSKKEESAVTSPLQQ